MATPLEERIREHAPGAAQGYYLELHHSDGKISRYPAQGSFPLSPFSPPSGTPFGSYMLYFVRYRDDLLSMTPPGGYVPSVRIQVPQTKKAVTDQAVRELHRAAGYPQESAGEDRTDDTRSESTERSLAPTDRMADLEFAIAQTPAMITARADYEKQRMAMELAENNQELLNKGQFSRDAAEALALSRAYRREAQISIEAQAHLTRRTAEEVQSHWAAFRMAQETQMEGMRLIREQLEMFAKPQPPPPPTDYTPAIVEGLKTLRDFGVAMVQTRAGVPLAPPPAATPSIPNQSTTAQVTPNPPVGPSGPEKPREAPKETPEADADNPLAVLSGLLGELPPASAEAPAVAAVAPVATPPAPSVAGVLDPSKDPKQEAARLWRTLAETSEFEALLATVHPEQLQAFLAKLRKRVKS